MAVCASSVVALPISLASSLAFSVAAALAAVALPPAFFSTLATAPSVFLASARCSAAAPGGGGGGGADAEFIVLALGAEFTTDTGEVTDVADVVDGVAKTESTVALPVADTVLAGSLR